MAGWVSVVPLLGCMYSKEFLFCDLVQSVVVYCMVLYYLVCEGCVIAYICSEGCCVVRYFVLGVCCGCYSRFYPRAKESRCINRKLGLS